MSAVAADDLTWWRAAVAGEKPLTSPDPECGYFKMRDRRGLNKKLAPIKRPWIACAIWKENGEFKAELAGASIEVDRIWPWCAKYPIPHEAYVFWHAHERWPSQEIAA